GVLDLLASTWRTHGSSGAVSVKAQAGPRHRDVLFHRDRSYMFKPLFAFIGTRYTRARRRSHFVSFISLTSMVGLALGVLVMILVLSVMNGFDHEMRTRVLGLVPHATLESPSLLDDWQSVANGALEDSRVLAAAPFNQAQGLLSHEGKVQKVLINAIDPALEPKVSIIDRFIEQ